MNEKTSKIVRISSGAAVSLISVIFGALLIWQVLDIYISGVNAGKEEFIFTQPELFSRFAKISPAFFVWVVAIIAAFVLWEIFPDKRKATAYNDARYSLMRLKKRMPYSFGEELAAEYSLVKNEERKLRILWSAVAAVGLAVAVYAIVYLCLPSSFPLIDAKGEVFDMMVRLLPCTAAVFLFACGVAVYEGVSAKKQLASAKKLAAVKKTEENSVKPLPSNKVLRALYTAKEKVKAVLSSKYFLPALRIAVGCVAIAFVVAGILNGNAGAVLRKAINICLECIGIG